MDGEAPASGGSAFTRRAFVIGGCQVAAASAVVARPAAAHASVADVLAALRDLATADPIAGPQDAAVGRVAVMTVPGLSAMRRAVAEGCTLVLSPESPFYANPAKPGPTGGPFAAMAAAAVSALEAEEPYRAKQALIAEHRLTVCRLRPLADAGTAAQALAARLGWTRPTVAGPLPVYEPAGLTLGALVERAGARLGARGGMRFIGDPAMKAGRVLVAAGTSAVVPVTRAMGHADTLLTGDLREWEIVEYLHDSAEAGFPKALVAVGRVLSEQPFVERCAAALRRAFPGLGVGFVPHADPFWRVQA